MKMDIYSKMSTPFLRFRFYLIGRDFERLNMLLPLNEYEAFAFTETLNGVAVGDRVFQVDAPAV